jgi:hypothetical protein
MSGLEWKKLRGRSFWHDGVVVGVVVESNGPDRKFWRAVQSKLGAMLHGPILGLAVCRHLVSFYRSYFFCSLPCASFSAVTSASTAFTFTSGSTPTSAQSVFAKGLIAFVSGMPIPK